MYGKREGKRGRSDKELNASIHLKFISYQNQVVSEPLFSVGRSIISGPLAPHTPYHTPSFSRKGCVVSSSSYNDTYTIITLSYVQLACERFSAVSGFTGKTARYTFSSLRWIMSRSDSRNVSAWQVSPVISNPEINFTRELSPLTSFHVVINSY